MSVHSRSSLSSPSKSSSTSTRRLDDDDEEEHALSFDFDAEPSFSSSHYQTSTPLKPTRASRVPRPLPSLEQQQQQQDDLLHASDTESLHSDTDLQGGLQTATRLRLTRRSLSHFTNSPSSSPSTTAAARPFNSSSTSLSTTPRVQPTASVGTLPGSIMARDYSGSGYTPSPSTGSSTLVEREEERPGAGGGRYSRSAKGKGKEDVTVRQGGGVSTLEEEDEQAPTVLPDDDGSSSSPRPASSFRLARRPGDLSSYIETHTTSSTPVKQPSTTPVRTPFSHRTSIINPPPTPLAPGAYPQTARKPRPPPQPQQTSSTPPSSGAKQVQDAFRRYITGPEGALSNSAERRAAAALAATPRREREREPQTPHPAGWYGFSPSASLPVERERERRKEVSWQEEEEEEEEEGEGSPLNRGTNVDGPKSKLERTLRHLGKVQREAEARGPAAVALVQYFEETGEVETSPSKGRENVEYEGDYESGDLSEEEVVEGRGGRSAIDFAMAKSFAMGSSPSHFSSGAEKEEEEHRYYPRQSSPPPPRPTRPVVAPAAPSPRRSPASTSLSYRHRPPTPPSPTLPELPPALSPQVSPSKPRVPTSQPHRRSLSSSLPPSHTTTVASSPPRSQPSPKKLSSSTPPRRTLPPSVPSTTSTTPPSLPHLVSQLSLAVQSLRLREDGLPALPLPSTRREETLVESLGRRKKASDGRRREMEKTLEGLEEVEKVELVEREQVVERLLIAQDEERGLMEKVEELQRSLNSLGRDVGDQVSLVVQSTLASDARKRTNFFFLFFSFQLVLLWLMLRLSNHRSRTLFDTVYYDPFAPSSLFHLGGSIGRTAFEPTKETVAFFSSAASNTGAMEGGKAWIGEVVRKIAMWGMVESQGTVVGVPS